MHVVQMRNAQPLGEPHADQSHLFMRVDRIVALGNHAAQHGKQHQAIEQQLGGRRTNPDLADERRTHRPENAQIRQLNVATDRVRDQVNVMAKFTERLDAVVFAERGPARLKKRLGREHQDAHESLYLTEPNAVRVESGL